MKMSLSRFPAKTILKPYVLQWVSLGGSTLLNVLMPWQQSSTALAKGPWILTEVEVGC